MAHRISSIVPLLFITLLCVGCVEGGYLALEYFFMKIPEQSKRVKSVGKPLPTEPVKKTGKEQTQDKHDYQIIFERNLFGPPPSAKKVEVKTDPLKDLETTTLNIALKGTISGQSDKGGNRAIILDKSSNTQQLYQKGDGIQGAFVKEILRTKVILSYNDKDEVLEMSDTAGTAEVARSVAVAPGKISKRITQSSAVRNVKKPARRIVRPRIIRPPKSKPAAKK